MDKKCFVQFSGFTPLYLDSNVLIDWLIININKIYDVYDSFIIAYDGHYCGIFYNDFEKCHYLVSYNANDVYIKLR